MSIRPSTWEEALKELHKFPNLDDIVLAAKALSILVAFYLPQPIPALDPRYEDPSESLALLKRAPELHQMLKQAHPVDFYEHIRNSDFIRRPDAVLPKEVQDYLDGIKPYLAAFLGNPTPIPQWDPIPQPSDPDLLAHLESLDILCLGGHALPLVILKDLGTFDDNPILRSRLDNIFVRGKKTLFVNTSGSGKTRLVFEGLTGRWGFYFTIRNFSIQDLGSNDVSRALRRLSADRDFTERVDASDTISAQKLARNHTLAKSYLNQLLLARLLIFRMFLEIVHETGTGTTEDHRMKWLLIQLVPYLDGEDIFAELCEHLCDYDAEESLSRTLTTIHRLLGHDNHIFITVDEGQTVAGTPDVCFPLAFDTDYANHPILLNMVDIWDQQFPAGSLSWVIAGTVISKHVFERPKYAGQVRWISDTGSFDDPSLHEQYLRRFLPPDFVSTDSGQAFLQRAWAWTGGRHRYTASLVLELIVWNFQKPHTVLDDYVAKFTKSQPPDGKRMRTLNFEMSYSEAVRFHLRSTIYHYLVAERHHPLFPGNNIVVVSIAFGRFIDAEMKEIAFDESMPVVGFAQWLTEVCSRNLPWDFNRVVHVKNLLACIQQTPPLTSKAFAACLAFYLARAFTSEPTLSDIFSFAVPIPAWAMQSAKLVMPNAASGVAPHSNPPVGPLVTSAHSVDDVVAWMEHAHGDRTPFCIPASEAVTPDLLFSLELSDGTEVSVVMRVSPMKSDGGDLLADLDDARLFCDPEHGVDSAWHKRAIELLNPPRRSKRKSQSHPPVRRVLRVVASFENQIDANVLATTTETPAMAQAVLCQDAFHHLMAALPTSLFVSTIQKNILKRKREIMEEEEEDVDVKGKGKERAVKRPKSAPKVKQDGELQLKGSRGKMDQAGPSGRVADADDEAQKQAGDTVSGEIEASGARDKETSAVVEFKAEEVSGKKISHQEEPGAAYTECTGKGAAETGDGAVKGDREQPKAGLSPDRHLSNRYDKIGTVNFLLLKNILRSNFREDALSIISPLLPPTTYASIYLCRF
ncbi:hypothetical protein R3P38DRAFT_3224990 [Favolaschia claudopus]|uniref:Uncharacterized protein n=1 Tax=Favolaschia claudopus TaxID=2862362 RepID=A0AAV9ZV33_9AGAR